MAKNLDKNANKRFVGTKGDTNIGKQNQKGKQARNQLLKNLSEKKGK